MPTFEDLAVARLVMQLELEIERRGHVLFAACSHEDESRETDIVMRMIDRRVGGVIVRPVKNRNSPATLLLDDALMPSVFVLSRKSALLEDCVVVDADTPVAALAAAAAGRLFARMDARPSV